jgi:hypothetical protein
MLRSERSGDDERYLWAYVDDDGNLHIDGQDLGPATAPVSNDGEYEWFQTVGAGDVPRLAELLGAQSGTDVLDLLEAEYTGRRSYDLEKVLRTSGIRVQRHFA